MTFDEFKNNISVLIENSNVNLGRKKTKTRSDFISSIMDQIDEFGSLCVVEDGSAITDQKLCDCQFGQEIDLQNSEEKVNNQTDDRLMCLKPGNKAAALDVGKGCHAMTSTQSRVADEELNRSPYGKGKGNG